MTLPDWFVHAPGAARGWLAARGPWARRVHAAVLPAMSGVSPARGSAWFPVAVEDRDFSGFLLEIRVASVPSAGDRLSAASTDRVRAWLARLAGCAVEEIAAIALVHDPVPSGYQVDGRSLEMAASVAWLSHLLGRAPAGPAIASGTVERDGWGRVAYIARKEAVCAAEAPGAPRHLLDEDVDAGPILAAWFGQGWAADLARSVGQHPSATAEEALRCFVARQFAEASAWARRALDQGATRRDAAVCTWILGTARLHEGRSDEAAALLDDATRQFACLDPVVDLCRAHEAEELEAYNGVALIDTGRPARAAARLEAVAGRLERQPRGDRRWREVQLQVLGTWARARLAAGDLEGAAELLERSDREVALPWEQTRLRMDLAEIHRRRGDEDAQRAALRAARDRWPRVRTEDRGMTLRFLELFELRARLRPSSGRAAPPDWARWPQPAEVAEHLLQTDPTALDAWLSDHLPSARGVQAFVLLGVAARRSLGGVASEEVRAAARAAAAAEHIDDVVRDALSALASGDPGPWARACPY